MSRSGPGRHDALAIALALACLPLLALAIALDVRFAASYTPWFYPTFVAAGLLIASCAWLLAPRRSVLIVFACFGLVLSGLRFVDCNPAKPLFRAYLQLRPGMAEERVRSLVAGQFPDGGRFAAPSVSSPRPVAGSPHAAILEFTLPPEAAPRSEAITLRVTFVDGVVREAWFSPL